MSLLRVLVLSQALGFVVGECSVNSSNCPGKLTRNTTSGIFAPHFPSSHPAVVSFPNIPYAQCPTGKLRFAPPVARAPPADGRVVHATDLPPGCVQSSQFASDTVYDAQKSYLLHGGNSSRSDKSEDCLRLSIFAPKATVHGAVRGGGRTPLPPLPVIVWIHGGGFQSGGIDVPYQLAFNWVQRSQRHLMVHVQYRLGLLGFPNAAGLAASGENVNLGLLDQRLAMEWVRANIASFGGDAERITLWGQSAGAFSTDAYLFAWAADPIVAGAIVGSGNALALEAYTGPSANHTHFTRVAASLGCAGLAPAAELTCMRSVPSSRLQNYLEALRVNGPIQIIADNVTVFSNYAARIAAGGSQFPTRLPLLLGTTTDEGNGMVSYSFNGSKTATSLPPALQSESKAFTLRFVCGTLREVRLRSEAGAPTWQYLYAGNFTDISPRPWLGAYHSSELPLVFGNLGIEGPVTGPFEHRASRYMQDLFLAFAEDPTGGLSRAGWPTALQGRKSSIMKWAADGKVGQLVDAHAIKLECTKNGYSV
ncbi:hypothetical protein RJ55_03615 [Drechmeria coniospora]|nr:hypothetical protein RJ55_03615 [Drechmeria coniospora]